MARRHTAMRPPACAWLLLASLLVMAAAQEAAPSPSIPYMTAEMQKVLPEYIHDEGSFWNLWEYALTHDAPTPPVPRNSDTEARTVLAPSLSAEMHLIPQDAGDVRFGSTPALKALRRDYLLDHLLTQSLPPSDPRLTHGVNLTTASGKEVTFTKNMDGVVYVNGVAAERSVTLPDNTVIYFLSDILFDNRERVTQAFAAVNHPDLASDPLGPPLDLPHRPIIRSPAPPPPGTPGMAQPPAIPPEHAIIRAPAPPTLEEPRPPAPPTVEGPPVAHHPLRTSEVVDPPAVPPPDVVARAPASSRTTTPKLVGPPANPPAKSPAAPPGGVGVAMAATLTTLMLL